MRLPSREWFESHQHQESDKCLHVREEAQAAASLVVLHVLLCIFSYESAEATLVTCLFFCLTQNQQGGKGQH